MASFAVAVVDLVVGALDLCKKCYKCCAEEQKDKEGEVHESEHGSDSGDNTKTKKKSNAAKTRKKRSAEYQSVEQSEPATTKQPQAQPTATQTLSTVISPIIHVITSPYPAIPANIPELSGMQPGPPTCAAATSRCGEGIVRWIPSSIHNAMDLLKEAVVGGSDINNSKLWIIRAEVEGEIILGKLNTKCCIAFVAIPDTDTYVETNVEEFEVCCVPAEHRHRIIWTECYDGKIPENAVLASTRNAKQPLYIGKKLHVDKKKGLQSMCPGMIRPDRRLWITFDFKVYRYDTFEVMCLE